MREVWEETGLTMQSPAYRGIVDFTCEPWPAERMHLYTCTDFTGTLTDCNEGTLEWAPKPEVENLPIWQGDKIFLRLLAEGAPFFHLELTYHGDTLVLAALEGDEQQRAAAGLALLNEYDGKIKKLLTSIFGAENDFDAILGGVNLAGVGANGKRVVQNLLEALTPILREGAERRLTAAAAAAAARADAARAERGAV